MALLHAPSDCPVGMVLLGVRGTPAPIQGALQPAYRGIVMAEAFSQLQLYPSQRPIGLFPAEADERWTKVDPHSLAMAGRILLLFPVRPALERQLGKPALLPAY